MPESHKHAGFGKTDALLFLMALIWGVNFSIVKFGTEVMSPLAFTGLRVFLAAVVLLSFALLRSPKLPSRRDIVSLMILGMLGNGLYQLMFVLGLAQTKVGNAALIVSAAPAFIAIASRLGGVERVNRRVAAGIALSLVGVALVVLGSAHAETGNATFVGTVLVFGGTLCWTAFTVLLQPFARRLDPVHLSAFTMLGGTIPLSIITSRSIVEIDWSKFGFPALAALFYAGVISMALAYVFWYRGLRVLGATRTAMYSNLQPVIAIVIAWIFLSEAPTIWQGVGTGTIMTGLFLTRT